MNPPGDAAGNYHSAIGISTVARRAWVGLGSNLGDRQARLRRALRWLSATQGIHLEAQSDFIASQPVGPPQPIYLNAVARVRTRLAPLALLDVLQTLERAAGRRRGERWGPRTLDLDLLLVDDVVMTGPRLVLPHPSLVLRPFVLGPLASLDPDLCHPLLDRSMSSLLSDLSG